MITCSICGSSNRDLCVTCTTCKSFLQSKVDALDLFATLWGLIEAPHVTFRRIALASRKTYTFLLSSVFGIFLVFATVRLNDIGDRVSGLHIILAGGALLGPMLGTTWLLLMSTIAQWISRKLGGEATRRNSFAVLSYATAPFVLSLFMVFPVEIAIFGSYFFGSNPSPMVIKPGIYTVLLMLDSLTMLWFVLLLTEGITVANSFSRAKGFLVALSIAGLTVGAAILPRFE